MTIVYKHSNSGYAFFFYYIIFIYLMDPPTDMGIKVIRRSIMCDKIRGLERFSLFFVYNQYGKISSRYSISTAEVLKLLLYKKTYITNIENFSQNLRTSAVLMEYLV